MQYLKYFFWDFGHILKTNHLRNRILLLSDPKLLHQEDQKPEFIRQNSTKPILNTARRKLRISRNGEENGHGGSQISTQGHQGIQGHPGGSISSAHSHPERQGSVGQSEGQVQGLENNERLRAILYKLAYKQLGAGEWKRLAYHWAFTDEQIRAIEHQYTGRGNFLLYFLILLL